MLISSRDINMADDNMWEVFDVTWKPRIGEVYYAIIFTLLLPKQFLSHSFDMRYQGNIIKQVCWDTKDLVEIILKYLWWKVMETRFI